MKIYVITEGDYSDAQIIGAVSTQAAADDLMRRLSNGNYVEMELDAIAAPLLYMVVTGHGHRYGETSLQWVRVEMDERRDGETRMYPDGVYSWVGRAKSCEDAVAKAVSSRYLRCRFPPTENLPSNAEGGQS